MDTLFGKERPSAPCEARIEIKLPTEAGTPGAGRPIKVWSGSSDTDEVAIQHQICKNEILHRIVHSRGLLQDGVCVLQGRLTFLDAAQDIGKHEIEVIYTPILRHDERHSVNEQFTEMYKTYARTLVDMKASHDAAIAKLGEHFSQGLGKVSEAASAVSTLAVKIHEDRANLNAALLSQLRSGNQPQTKPESMIDQIVKVGGLVKALSDVLGKSKSDHSEDKTKSLQSTPQPNQLNPKSTL